MRLNKLLTLFAALTMAATVSAQVTFTCTAGAKYGEGEGIDKLFDNNNNTKYCGDCGDGVYALFTASETVYVWGYEMTTANDNETYDRCVGKWQLYGTNDATVGANADAKGWVALSDLGRNEMVQRKNFYTQRFFCEKGINKPFKYFKLVLNERKKYRENDTDRYDGTIQLSEFKLLAEVNRVASYKWKASSQDNSKKAVDLTLGQKWEGSNIAGNWVTIETGDGQAYAVKSYSFSTNDDGSWNDRAPKSWKIEGSNDNSTWTLIDERVDDDDIENANFKTFEFMPNNTTDKFRYIRLTLNAMKSTGWTQVGEFHVLSIADISDAQYYTNLVNAAKATKTEYETFMGESDPWCVEYNTFFTGLDLDNVLATAISSGDYATLEAKLAEAENNAIGQAIKLFVNGVNYAAIAGSGDKCWGDGHYSQLFDGKDTKEDGTKWGGNGFPQYVIFRVKAAFKPFFYKLVTGNDTASNNGRNWKTWSVYGGNFDTFSAAADSALANWTLLDERVNVSEEYLPMKNFYPATFDFNKGVSKEYMYYMVVVAAPHADTQQQMEEMYLCTQEEFESMRTPLVEEFAEFAAGLDALVVESSVEADKTTFNTLYAELKTTADAVRMTKVYNDLVALKEKLLDSSAFATGGFRVLSGNTAWGDNENWTKLLDGKYTKEDGTKWGGGMPEGGSYVIFKTYAANAFNQYMLVTGNDTKNSPGRNWKSWKIYGANIKGDMDEMATRDFGSWTLIDEKTNIGQDRLPAANYAPAYFNFTNPKGYKYFKIEVEAPYSGDAIQMSEFMFLTDDAYAAARQEYVTTLQTAATGLAALEAEIDLPADKKEQLMAQLTDAITAKINAVATAKADDLLPLYNDAMNYINVEAPTLVAIAQLVVVDGVYQLAKAKDLAVFATLVNTGTNEAKAVLTANIDLSEVITNNAWTSIGNNDVPFKGELDGQGYTIKNITYTATGQYNGLFGKLSTGAVVKNFTAEGTMTVSTGVTGRAVALIAAAESDAIISNINSKMNYNNQLAGAQVGGILGGSLNGTETIDRCTYSGILDGNDAGGSGNYGGIVGYVNNNSAALPNVTNCLFDGELKNSAATPGNCTFGGIVGYAGASPKVTIKNCLSIGTIQSAITGQFFGAVKSNKCTIVNSFYQGTNVNGSASTVTPNPQEATEVTNEQLASNEVVLGLGIAFRQNLGTDAYPVLDATHNVVTKITEAGYSTLFVDNADIKVPEGVSAYTAEFEETWLKLNAVTGAVAAGEPVVLKGAAGVYSFAPTTGAIKVEGNVLKGAETDIEAADKYVLAKVEDKVGFYLADKGTIKAGKAYIVLDSNTGPLVKAFYFAEEDATGIANVNVNDNDNQAVIYNVAGQRVSKMQKGINIVNGKKILK